MWRAYERAVENGADSWTQFELWVDGFFNNNIFDLFVNQTYSVMTNEVLTAVPLFLFMGYIVERANIVSRLFGTLNVAARRVPGSMAVAGGRAPPSARGSGVAGSAAKPWQVGRA